MTQASEYTLHPDKREVSDTLYLFITSGNRLGIAITRHNSDHAATYLTLDEWRDMRMEGDRLVAMIEAVETA